MIRDAYAKAVEILRRDPYYPLPIPTVYELAAQYRRVVQDARLDDIRALAMQAGLPLADVDVAAMTAAALHRPFAT